MRRLLAAITAIFLLAALPAGAQTFPGAFVAPAAAADAPKAAAELASVAGADLEVAIQIANANNDADGAACATAIKTWLAGITPPAATAAPIVAVGPFSAYEQARVKVKSVETKVQKIQAGAPREVVIGCAMVLHDARSFLARLGAIAAGAR